jgi:hypothetical protein
MNREDLGLGLLIVVALVGGYAMQWAGQPPQYLTHGMDAYQPPPDVVVELPAPVVDVSEDVRKKLDRLERMLEETQHYARRMNDQGVNVASIEGTDATDMLNQHAAEGLDAAGIRAALGMSAATLDAQLSTIDSYIDTEIASILVDTDTVVDVDEIIKGILASDVASTETFCTIGGTTRVTGCPP